MNLLPTLLFTFVLFGLSLGLSAFLGMFIGNELR
jgi:hypothetical protein